jgi:hypothetical protein
MTKIVDYFSEIADPREQYKCRHRLSDILLIGLFTYLSNGQDYEDMVLFGKTKGKEFPELLILSKGVPSHDTFNRVFKILDCELLRKCSYPWSVSPLTNWRKKHRYLIIK